MGLSKSTRSKGVSGFAKFSSYGSTTLETIASEHRSLCKASIYGRSLSDFFDFLTDT